MPTRMIREDTYYLTARDIGDAAVKLGNWLAGRDVDDTDVRDSEDSARRTLPYDNDWNEHGHLDVFRVDLKIEGT